LSYGLLAVDFSLLCAQSVPKLFAVEKFCELVGGVF